jgi:hypothetical protein
MIVCGGVGGCNDTTTPLEASQGNIGTLAGSANSLFMHARDPVENGVEAPADPRSARESTWEVAGIQMIREVGRSVTPL